MWFTRSCRSFIQPMPQAGRPIRRKPLFYHQHGVFDPERLRFRSMKKMLYIKAIERPIMRQATTFIAGTKAEVDSYRALGVQTHCRIIPNGVDRWYLPQSFAQTANSRFHILPDDLVILLLARLHPIKGAERLIRSFLMIHHRFPKARLSHGRTG